MDPFYSLAGGFVGFLVGLTGVGGGSLMAPLLILLFGVSPALAIGTDLWFATITKSVGGAIHHRMGFADWKVVMRLAAGSVPAAVLTLLWLAFYKGGQMAPGPLLHLLGFALLISAVMILLKPRMTRRLALLSARVGPTMQWRQLAATVVCGAGVGALVTLTSVGAGALVAVLLAVIYPLRLGAKDIVGTDIVHAVPLTLVAALGHSWLGNVDLWLLASLLVGSVPGIIAGSLLAGKINEHFVRYALAAMLVVSATKMILN